MKKTFLILTIGLLSTTLNANEINQEEWQTVNLNNLDDFPKDGSKLIDKNKLDNNGEWTNFNDLVKKNGKIKTVEEPDGIFIELQSAILKEAIHKYPNISEEKIKQFILLIEDKGKYINKEKLFKRLNTYQEQEEAL